MNHRVFQIGAALACCLACIKTAAAQAPAEDKYLWLEDVSGDRSMTWVKAENAKTDAVLQKDPRYQANFDDALKLAEDPRRLAAPGLRGDQVYNNWRDASNPRGLLRKTTVADYLTETPHWTTVIDFDALGKAARSVLPLPRQSILHGPAFGGRRRRRERAGVRSQIRTVHALRLPALAQ
jgi:prolyl oligopeptidase